MIYEKYFCHLTILLLSSCFMAVKCSLDPADQFIDSPSDIKHDALSLHKRPSFFVGSRYGRSGSSSGSSVFATSKTRRLNVVPRNDRFFLSSRYGKRAGMDYLKTHNKNYEKNMNENSILAPLLSTPYEQALISEISTGTQLSSKPVPSQQQQQQQQQFNDDFNPNHASPSPSSSSSSVLPPYVYMSCVYTGLQNYYRCTSIASLLQLKNLVINNNNEDENENEVLSTDRTVAALFNNGRADDADDDDNDVDENDGK